MKRRTIRSFFTALLLLFIAGWLLSYGPHPRARHYTADRCWWLEAAHGRIYFALWTRFAAPATTGWRFDADPTTSPPPVSPEFLGFALGGRAREIAGHPAFLPQTEAQTPFWFLTSLSALLLAFAWRKTSPPKPETAFSVQPPPPHNTHPQIENRELKIKKSPTPTPALHAHAESFFLIKAAQVYNDARQNHLIPLVTQVSLDNLTTTPPP